MTDHSAYLERAKLFLEGSNPSDRALATAALFLQAVEHQAELKLLEKENEKQLALQAAELKLAAQAAQHQAQLELAAQAAKAELALKLAEKEKEKEQAVKAAQHNAELNNVQRKSIMDKVVESARHQAEMDLLKKEQEMLQTIDQLKQESERELTTLRYKYAAVSSRFWLERLFRDVCKFATEKSWPDAKLFSGNGGPMIMSAVNKYLATHEAQWASFVQEKGLGTVQPFPQLPDATLLYGALSGDVHNPADLCVLQLEEGCEYKPYLVLLRDIGEYYSKMDNLQVSHLNISQAIAGIITNFEGVGIDPFDL